MHDSNATSATMILPARRRMHKRTCMAVPGEKRQFAMRRAGLGHETTPETG
jgi:hypothetical protein